MYMTHFLHALWRYSPYAALLLLLCGGTLAVATEEPAFEVVAEHGKIEVRRYPATIQAITPMPESNGSDNGFRRLAGFIFGGNSTGESIAMTAPVQRNLTGEVKRMTFYMPSTYDMQSLPTPQDPNVTLREVPAQTVAVVRFSGRATEKRVSQERDALEQGLREEGIAWQGDWLLNQYNPPWTPPFMRRNEIWVEVDLPSR